jgi:predicted DNA-binding ribbon-helix-helix protein
VERVQLGVRMEKRLVKVLKGLAEFEGLTLGQLLEKIVLHSFVSVPGEEGEMAASPHSKRALAAVSDFMRIYGMDYELHRYRQFQEDADEIPNTPGSPGGSS